MKIEPCCFREPHLVHEEDSCCSSSPSCGHPQREDFILALNSFLRKVQREFLQRLPLLAVVFSSCNARRYDKVQVGLGHSRSRKRRSSWIPPSFSFPTLVCHRSLLGFHGLCIERGVRVRRVVRLVLCQQNLTHYVRGCD